MYLLSCMYGNYSVSILEYLLCLYHVEYLIFKLKLHLNCLLWHNFRIQKFILRFGAITMTHAMISKNTAIINLVPSLWF